MNTPAPCSRGRRNGFALIELLITVGILGGLITIGNHHQEDLASTTVSLRNTN